MSSISFPASFSESRYRVSWNVRNDVGTTSDRLLASLAFPDADRLALNRNLSAECAGVLCVLADFHLLHLLTQRGTISL